MRDSEDSERSAELLAALTPVQLDWALASEERWRRAHALAQSHAGIDPSDFYHALRCLELSPTHRLRLGLRRGRLGSDPR